MSIPVYCENTDLAVEARARAQDVGLDISAELSADPLNGAAHAARDTGLACALCITSPGALGGSAAEAVLDGHGRVAVALLGDESRQDRGMLCDLGFPTVSEVAPAISLLALLRANAERAFRASPRKLSELDRIRLGSTLSAAERAEGRLQSLGAAGVALQTEAPAPEVLLGRGNDVREALASLAASAPQTDEIIPFLPPRDPSASRDILFGPPRVLSDPASKAALHGFGLPLPQEELCASPSRAAAEAARIGFPVRISLASPDLRVWKFPDLSVDGVDNAARVRDIYRQLTTLAQERSPEARLLGVTVTATTLARALFRIRAEPLATRRVLLRLGFSDPHGSVARDALTTVLPQSKSGVIRTIERLAGAPLLLGTGETERDEQASLLGDLFARIGAFIDTFREEVARLDLNPVALLVGGGAEIREAAVHVTDAFMRDLR